MEPFFIASLPGEPAATLKKVQENISSIDTPFPLDIPSLKTGTLDNLLTVADSVIKTDQFMQQLTYKIEKQLREFVSSDALLVDESFCLFILLGYVCFILEPIQQFFTTFKWDATKYKIESMSLPAIVASLTSVCSHLLSQFTPHFTKTAEKIDQQMKERGAQFTQTNNSLQALERRSSFALLFFYSYSQFIIFSGSLNVRNLSDIIGENDFIQSEKLTTVFVVVSRGQIKDWTKSYFTLADRVVPHSSRLVAEDDQTVLYSVVLFKTSVDQFKVNAREARFQVREFTQSAETPQSIEEEKVRLRALVQSQTVLLIHFFPPISFCSIFRKDTLSGASHPTPR